MVYEGIKEGVFLERPNRFIAKVCIDGKEHTVHVKNTGRCKELLLKGAPVYLKYEGPAEETGRKTEYSLIAVKKGGLLINMDSQAPNQVAFEALSLGLIEGISAQDIKREYKYGSSRFDVYFKNRGRECFMEVKGVTLEEKGFAKFPDAPTERGSKHLSELAKAAKEGYGAYVLFLLQMENMKEFSPNYETDPGFSKALYDAREEGVNILCYDCRVAPDSLELGKKVPVRL